MRVYGCPANLFVAVFFGSLAMNLLRGRVEPLGRLALVEDGACFDPPAILDPSVAASARDIVIGLRPEDLRFAREAAAGEVRTDARLDSIEAVGCDPYLNLCFGTHDLVARALLAGRSLAARSR
jgi:multiple sugar transport system ATP-binding protein